jgi:shikimate 5-dehydrogenase
MDRYAVVGNPVAHSKSQQAAESFFVWRGIRPGTWPAFDALRRAG